MVKKISLILLIELAFENDHFEQIKMMIMFSIRKSLVCILKIFENLQNKNNFWNPYMVFF